MPEKRARGMPRRGDRRPVSAVFVTLHCDNACGPLIVRARILQPRAAARRSTDWQGGAVFVGSGETRCQWPGCAISQRAEPSRSLTQSHGCHARMMTRQRWEDPTEKAPTPAGSIAGSCGDRSKRAGRVRPPRRRGRVAIHSQSPQNHPTATPTVPITSPAVMAHRRENIGQSGGSRPGAA